MRLPAPRIFLPAAAALLLVVLVPDATACPNCKSAVADAGDASKVGDQATGLSLSIYLMLGALFSIAGGIVAMIVRVARRIEAAETPPV